MAPSLHRDWQGTGMWHIVDRYESIFMGTLAQCWLKSGLTVQDANESADEASNHPIPCLMPNGRIFFGTDCGDTFEMDPATGQLYRRGESCICHPATEDEVPADARGSLELARAGKFVVMTR